MTQSDVTHPPETGVVLNTFQQTVRAKLDVDRRWLTDSEIVSMCKREADDPKRSFKRCLQVIMARSKKADNNKVLYAAQTLYYLMDHDVLHLQ